MAGAAGAVKHVQDLLTGYRSGLTLRLRWEELFTAEVRMCDVNLPLSSQLGQARARAVDPG